jgi:tryptophanyl-tRNA synthetase
MVKSNRVRIEKDVNRSLEYYMTEQGATISGIPGVKMSKSDVVSEILMNHLAGKGHYPPKDAAEVKP